MLFEVTHTTQFSYSQPVFLEPHHVRLRPRYDGRQRPLCFDMRVEPSPEGMSTCTDLDGNVTDRVWFSGPQETLNITTSFRAETLDKSAFDFLLDPSALTLPMVYTGEMEAALAPYRDRAASSEDEIGHFAEGISREVHGETVPFLGAATERIHNTCQLILRPEGDPWPASATLAEGQGACRDVAVLLIDACRALGLAARFVSGYQEGDPGRAERELHAWAEIYLPGAGWRGYDPTSGLAVTDRHVAVAAGPTAMAAAPTSGTFRGTGATSTLYTDIRMTVTGR